MLRKENQRSSVKFLSAAAVVHACRYCSESCEAEVTQGTSLPEGLPIELRTTRTKDNSPKTVKSRVETSHHIL